MFGGDNEEIEFNCNMELLYMVIEQFGKDIILTKVDEHTFNAKVNASINGFEFLTLRNTENAKHNYGLRGDSKEGIGIYLLNFYVL